MPRKILGWLALIIAMIWLLHNPAGAAHLARQVMHAIETLANSL